MRKLLTLAAVAALTAGLAACSGKTAGGDDAADTADGAITVATDDGDVALDAPATKVVALEWVYVEDLLSMGVTPVGVADVDGYNQWVTATEPLGEEVTDVGTRQEPSIEQIKALQPDLVVADAYRTDVALDELREFTDVVVYNSIQPDRSPWDTLEFHLTQLGVATGQTARAQAALDDLDTAVSTAVTALADAGRAEAPVALCQAFTVEDVPQLRLYGPTSLAGETLTKLGLTNTWDGEPDDWGMTTIGVEGLTALPDDTDFLYVAAESDDPFTGALADNALWKDLAFVADDRVRALDPGTWLVGGAASVTQLIDETVAAVTG